MVLHGHDSAIMVRRAGDHLLSPCQRPPAIPADHLPDDPWQGSSVKSATPAVTEVVVALVLVGLAWWCWHRGVIVTVRRGVAMNRVEGSWWAAATGAITLAGLLLLDAARRVMGKTA
jgi:hypothetical protein